MRLVDLWAMAPLNFLTHFQVRVWHRENVRMQTKLTWPTASDVALADGDLTKVIGEKA